MAINFQYRCGILEAADTTSDTEWCWFKGDTEITKSRGGEPAGTVSAPPGAPVAEVKAIIRNDAKQ
ncbi:MAG: hypothetical protein ACRDC0_16545 [Aeromonas veronii]